MGKWDLLLPESLLKELMLDKLLNRYLMITLGSETQHNSAVRASRKVFIFILIAECIHFIACVSNCNTISMVLKKKSCIIILLCVVLCLDSRWFAIVLVEWTDQLFASVQQFQESSGSENSYHLQRPIS